MKSLSDYIDPHCKFLTFLPTGEIHLGGIMELGWVIGLVKHAIWTDSLYFLYLLLF
jgi:hypothetical protein